MANPTYYDPTDAETVKAWENNLDIEVRYRAPKFDPDFGFYGTEMTRFFCEKTDLTKSSGDRVRMTLRWNADPANKLKTGNAAIEGNELGIETSTDDIDIDESRQAFKSESRMTPQRVRFDAIDEQQQVLADYWADQLEMGASIHLSGASGVTDAAYNFHNTPTAPHADRISRVNDRTNDEDLVEGDELNASTINQTIAKVKQTRPRVRPGRIAGMTAYVWLLHANQVAEMKETDSDFFNLHLKALEGGEVDNNPIFTGNLGVYQGVIFLEDDWVMPGIHSSTGLPVADTRRSVLLGAGSLALAYGREGVPGGYSPNKYLWFTYPSDANKWTSTVASSIMGMKSPQYARPTDSAVVDYGKHVVSSYARDFAGQEDFWTTVLS